VHGERSAHDSAALARPHGNFAASGLHGKRKAGDCEAVFGEARAGSDGFEAENLSFTDEGLFADHSALHA